MTTALTPSELLQLRMRAQLLSRSREASGASSGLGALATADPDPGQFSGPQRIAAVTRHMLALQGQDWPSSRWALGVRAPGTGVADVHAAFDEGLIVRSWPMRGTVHVVAAEDIGWMQELTSARVLRGAAKRREFLGLDDATLERVVEASLTALAGGARLTREELSDAWTAAGIEWQSSWRYHLVWWLCQNGLAVLGPVSQAGAARETASSEPLIVRAEDWISAPRRLSGDEALCELAARYAAARGPVTAKDLAWWAGLTMGDSKRGLALAAESGALQQVAVAGSLAPHWCAGELLGGAVGVGSDPDAVPSSSLLLPAFDEHLLGYTDRSPQLDPAHFDRIVPGRNGVFRATVVAGGPASRGVVHGTWQRARSSGSNGTSARIVATPMPGCELLPEDLTEPVTQWAQFHGFAGASAEVV
ncbi:winged helix DNA-binding domain-containing protein [Leucobacter salsicius]|uniref:winged helix DNA-binding domain-containing protein n=1 Tax=Leucobacter salsicius TaxID=664638 RepID=UPI00034666F4|nr:winged helix DNA-binding domain-containing protein [Leucobacter salsicius]